MRRSTAGSTSPSPELATARLAMLTMMHSNHARVQGDRLVVDRKFHVGMQAYLGELDVPIVSVHPESRGDESTMDMVDVPLAALGYRVLTVPQHGPADAAQRAFGKLEAQLRSSDLIYGTGLGSETVAERHGIRQIAILEYDLPTQIKVSASQVTNPLRRAVRAVRITRGYRRNLDHWRRCAALHCNGYPIYDATEPYNPNRLLYLDSRMYRAMVITEADLERRLASRPAGRLKLLFSGRFESFKGALDAVEVGRRCLRRGLDVELHCYGQGSQSEAMRAVAARPEVRGRIVIHPAVPYPELVEISRGFDLFVCCHTQADPSCTYLESFGAGLPIVGYANTMWRLLNAEAKAGLCSSLGRPERVVDDIARLIADPGMLDAASRRAQRFAAAHTFETEFKRRTDDIGRWLRAARPGAEQASAPVARLMSSGETTAG